MKIGFVQFSYGTVVFGAGSVIGALLAAGHDVVFFNLNNAVGNNFVEKTIQEIKVRRAVKKLIQAECSMYFFSAMTMDMPLIIDVICRLKKDRNIPVVVGGVHPTVVQGKVLEEHPEINYICVGEGESAVVEIARCAHRPYNDDLQKVQNLGWRKTDGTVVVNPIRKPEDLSKLPEFPWHLYPRNYAVNSNGTIYLRATRGCPYHCTFCCNSAYLDLYGKDYLRKRPIKDVIYEMKLVVRKFAPENIIFTDEMLVFDKEYCIELFRTILKDVGIPWGFMARVEYIDDELVRIAAECGCFNVGMGVECGDENFRREKLGRKNTNAQIENAYAILKKYGIETSSFNMIGYPFPGDDERTKTTIELNRKIKPDFVQFSIFYPFPGTKLYDYCVENDLIDHDKQARMKSLYDDSILRGVSLKQKREELTKMFNKTNLYVRKK